MMWLLLSLTDLVVQTFSLAINASSAQVILFVAFLCDSWSAFNNYVAIILDYGFYVNGSVVSGQFFIAGDGFTCFTKNYRVCKVTKQWHFSIF